MVPTLRRGFAGPLLLAQTLPEAVVVDVVSQRREESLRCSIERPGIEGDLGGSEFGRAFLRTTHKSGAHTGSSMGGMHAQLVHIQSVACPPEGASTLRLVLQGDVADQRVAALSDEGEPPVGSHELGVKGRRTRYVIAGPEGPRLRRRVNVLDVPGEVDEKWDITLRIRSSDREGPAPKVGQAIDSCFDGI